MIKEKKLVTCQAILKNLGEVIEDIKEGNVIGSFGRKIIELSYHHPKIPRGLHLDDYFTSTFSFVAYFLMNYPDLDKGEVIFAKKMVQQLDKSAGNLLETLLNQQSRFQEYIPRTKEFTVQMSDVWEPKFKPICSFLQQFVNLRYGQRLNAYLIDMKTPIVKETVKFDLQTYGLLEDLEKK